MWRVVEFITEYGIYGRVSAESHDAVHAKLGRIKQVIGKMPSTEQRMTSFHTRASSNLKDGVPEATARIEEKRCRKKKRGPYITSAKTKREDEVEFVEAVIFENEKVAFEGEDFLKIANNGGRIHARFERAYLYACAGRAPEDWLRGLEACQLLLRSRIEAAKLARH